MKPVVVRNIQRADASAVATMQNLGVSTVHEALGRSGLMKPYIRPIWSGAQIAGPAVTILAQPGDNWMIHVAVEQCQKGDVVVLGCTADNTDGMFGELLATSLNARGVKGLIIDAGCRDVRALHEMSFPVWSRAISASAAAASLTFRCWVSASTDSPRWSRAFVPSAATISIAAPHAPQGSLTSA